MKLYCLVFNFDSAETKINTDGRNVTFGKGVILFEIIKNKPQRTVSKMYKAIFTTIHAYVIGIAIRYLS